MKRAISSSYSFLEDIADDICREYGLRIGTIELQRSAQDYRSYVFTVDVSNLSVDKLDSVINALQALKTEIG